MTTKNEIVKKILKIFSQQTQLIMLKQYLVKSNFK